MCSFSPLSPSSILLQCFHSSYLQSHTTCLYSVAGKVKREKSGSNHLSGSFGHNDVVTLQQQLQEMKDKVCTRTPIHACMHLHTLALSCSISLTKSI